MAKLDIKNSWFSSVKQIKSQNYSQRIDKEDISLIVIHCISLPPKLENYSNSDDVIDFFCNKLDCGKHPFYKEIKDLKVSPHLFIKRTGEIIQLVRFDDKAWHAGKSNYKGRNNCNEFSIGIELEGDENYFYTDKQYQSLIKVTKTLKNNYPKIQKNITGHSTIAPKRKTDPGKLFDWERYLSYL